MRITPYALAAAVACLAACSADNADAKADDAGLSSPDAGTVEAAPELSGRIRLVNLWADDGKPGTVDLYVSRGVGNFVPLFTGVKFGDVTEPAAVEADAVVFAYRSGGQDVGNGAGSPDFIGTETLRADLEHGHPLTLVLGYTRPLRDGGPSASITPYIDGGDTVVGSMPARAVTGALLVTDVSPANRVTDGRARVYHFGVPGEGCLQPAGASPSKGIRVSVGGTASAEYDVSPGSSKVAAYDGSDARCAGSPALAAVDVAADAGRRNYVFAYGTSAGDLRLLFVPGIPSP